VPRLDYVDSQSTNNSVKNARAASAKVVALDMSIPFSVARARNAGLEHLKAGHTDVRFVQFIDGDCELDAGWLRTALSMIEEHDHVASVCGRRRERSPESSLYNLVCDLEWDTPIGEAFNSELRSECLNAHWFLSLQDACEKLEAWRRHYNEERPQSTIGNTTPIMLANSAGETSPPDPSKAETPGPSGPTSGSSERRLKVLLVVARNFGLRPILGVQMSP
jgi:hypothetical protein